MSTVKFVRLIYISKCKSILGTKIQMIIVVVIVTRWFGQINADDIMCLSELINSRINKSLFEIGKKKSYQNVPLCD